MAYKINQLTALGRNLIGTDELELSLKNSAGSRKITGAQIIGAIPSGIKGVHTIIPVQSGRSPSAIFNGLGAALTSASLGADILATYPYKPANDVAYSALYINATFATAGSFVRILIYSDLNGIPDQKLFESTNLDCSTTGIKSINTSGTFVAGTTYWLAIYCNIATSLSHIPATNMLCIGTNVLASYVGFFNLVTFGSAPSPFVITNPYQIAMPFIGITQ